MKKVLPRIARKYRLRLIIGFGSVFKKEPGAPRDIDIAVVGERSEDLARRRLELAMDLAKAFPRQEVDCVIANFADPLFLKQIIHRGKLLYGSRRAFEEFALAAIQRYQDYHHYLEEEAKFVGRAFGRD